MSDRDPGLTDLFVRDIDQIDLPPRDAWRPAPRTDQRIVSAFRSLAYASVAGLVLILALFAGMSLRDRGVPAASPSPSAPPATATPTATATGSASPTPTAAAGVLDERFGFVIFEDRARVRSETSDAEIISFVPGGRSFVFHSRPVSPDGRFVAYWAPDRNGAVLHVRAVTGGSARAVLTTAPEMSGNAFAWSSDGTGLVVALDNDCQEFCGGPQVAELWTVDLASGTTEKVASGSFWLPVTWDRVSQLVAAGATGPGGYLTGYDLIDLDQKPYAVRSTEFRPTFIGRLRASSDARYVFASDDFAGAITWWPLAEPEKRSTIEFDGVDAQWRPGTSEIWWVGGLTPAGCRALPCSGTELISFDVATGARTVAFRGEFGRYLAGFRVDGSAAITASYGSGPAAGSNASDVTFVEIATGRTADLRVLGAFGEPVRLR